MCAALTKVGDIREGSSITVNGEEGSIPKRLVGVVWQDDLLLSNLTVEENIYFAARLKTSERVPDAEVRNVVEETMGELSLTHIRHSVVGSPLGVMRGVSGGERKRVSVGAELVVRPSLLLLDEPTSGLDATTAQALIGTLRDLADIGHSIAVVIHQPRTTIFNMFDHLVLLSKGNMIYDGVPCRARSYLEGCPSVQELPPETGIADWIMDVIKEDESRKEGASLANMWTGCQVKQSFVAPPSASATSSDLSTSRRLSSLEELNAVPRYSTGFKTQLKLLTQRTLKQQRGERLTATAAGLQFAYFFFTALFWWQLPDTTAYIFDRNSLLFFMIVAQANGIVITAVTVFQRERALLRRERAKKLYAVSAYFLGKTVSDLTNNVLLPLLYGMLVYWTAGYRVEPDAFFKFTLAFYLTLSTAQAMGIWMSIAIPSMHVALVLAPPLTLFFIIMGGFYIPYENMHKGVYWASWLSFARYGYSALIINEYAGRDIACASADELSISIGGASDSCPLLGDDIISSLGISGVAESYWFNVGMCALLQVLFRCAAYVSLRRSK